MCVFESLGGPFLFLEHPVEGAVRIGHESSGRVVLNRLALIHHEDSVTLDDRVQTMSYAKDCGSLELLTDQSLGGLLGHNVNVGSCFIEDDDFVAAEDSSDDADELTLTHAQVVALFLDFEVEALVLVLFLFSLDFSCVSDCL